MGLIRLRCRHLPNQSRLLRCPKRHRLPHHLLSPLLLHHLHRLLPLQTLAPRAPTSRPFLPRSLGHGDQHHRAHVPDLLLRLLLLPNRASGHAADYELERRYVRRYHLVCDRVLSCDWA